MCTPLAAGAALLSVAGGAMEMSAMNATNRRQQSANDQWLAYQRRMRQEENTRQEDARQTAEASRASAAEKFTPANQQQQLTEGTQKYTEEFTKPTALDQTADALRDQLAGGTKDVNPSASDFAGRVAGASKEARARIQALAQLSSYGGGQYGLQTANQNTLGQSAIGIEQQGRLRANSLNAYGAEKQVEPLKYSYTPGAGKLLSSLAGAFV